MPHACQTCRIDVDAPRRPLAPWLLFGAGVLYVLGGAAACSVLGVGVVAVVPFVALGASALFASFGAHAFPRATCPSCGRYATPRAASVTPRLARAIAVERAPVPGE